MELTSIHPGVYLLYYFIMVLFAFIFSDPYFVVTFLILILILIALQGVSSELKNIMKLFIPLSVLIMILNPLLNRTGAHKIYLWPNFFITYEAIAYGVLMSLALLIVILVFSSYNRSVSYQEMLYIFSKKLPIISMIIVMALRFIPLINSRAIEVQKLNNLKNNGIEFDEDGTDGNNDSYDSNRVDLDEFNSNINTDYDSKFVNKLKSNKRVAAIIKEAKTLGKIMGITVSWSLEESMFTAKSILFNHLSSVTYPLPNFVSSGTLIPVSTPLIENVAFLVIDTIAVSGSVGKTSTFVSIQLNEETVSSDPSSPA